MGALNPAGGPCCGGCCTAPGGGGCCGYPLKFVLEG